MNGAAARATRLPIAAVAVVAVVAVFGPSTAARATDVARTMKEAVLDSLNAVEASCPSGADEFREVRIVVCAKAKAKRDEFRKVVDAATREVAGKKVKVLVPWSDSGDAYRVSYELAGVLFVAARYPSGKIALEYPRPLPRCDDLPTRRVDPPYRFGEGATTAKKICCPGPRYPEFARKHKLEGKVYLRATVERDGTVSDLCIRRSTPQGVGFEEAALDAVRDWRYEPGTFNGKPVPIELKIIVDFTMQ
jgi:TonB family protein